MKAYITEMQIYDDDLRLLATVKAEDVCAIVELAAVAHDVNSWIDLAASIREAIVDVCKP